MAAGANAPGSHENHEKVMLLQGLVLVAAGLWSFTPTIHGDWLWDDHWLITSNETLRSWHGLRQMWFAPAGPDYWPLTSTLLWMAWHLWGAATVPYHLCTVTLHLVSGFLVWRLLSRLGLRWAWLGGFLFVIHPLAVESVAWISEVKNTFSLPFFLLSLDAWLDAEEGRKNGYVCSLLCYAAGMLAKTSGVMLPAVLLLYCWWKRGRITRREILKIVPYLAIALTLGLITIHFQSHMLDADAAKARAGFPPLIGAGVAIFFYLGKFLLPIGLLPVYPRWKFDACSFLPLLTLPLLSALFLGLWVNRRGWGRHALFGLGFFVLTLLPVLGFVEMSYMNVAWVADHFMYLPMIGLIGLAVAGLEAIHGKLPGVGRPWLVGLIAALSLALAWKDHAYAEKFISQEALWSYTLEFNPDCKEAHLNLGNVLFAAGRVPEAMEHFKAALRTNPHFAEASNNAGFALETMGRIPEAMAQYEAALKIRPSFTQARDNLTRVRNLQKIDAAKK